MLDAMEHFIQVVETGSFSAAGKILNKNASSVARQIDKLEAELGARLLNRSTRRLELTLSGQSFYHQSVEIVNAVSEARSSVQQHSDQVRGSVSVSVLDSYGSRKITPILPEFCQTYPYVNVALSLDNSVVDLYESPVDLAIRYGRPVDSNLIMKSLDRRGHLLVASPSYLDNAPPIRQPEDLKDHPCLTLHRQRQHVFWYFQKAGEQRRIKVDGPLSAKGGEPLIEWAKQGLGITLITHWGLEPELERGELVEILPEWRASLMENNRAEVYMVWTPTATQKPAVRCLIDYLCRKLQVAEG